MVSSDAALGQVGKMVGATILYFVFMIFIVIPINGLLLALAWNWFVVPVFKLSAIGVFAAIGLAIFLSVILPRSSSDYWKSSEIETSDLQGRIDFFWRNLYGSISNFLKSKVLLLVVMLIWRLLIRIH